MNQLKVFALGAAMLFASTTAMALRAPQSDPARPGPAGSVIDVILNRDASVDGQSVDGQSKEQIKQQRKRDKELRKQQHERDKDLRKQEKEREKDLLESERERAKHARKGGRGHARE